MDDRIRAVAAYPITGGRWGNLHATCADDKAFVPRAKIQPLDGVGKGAGIELPQPFELFGREVTFWHRQIDSKKERPAGRIPDVGYFSEKLAVDASSGKAGCVARGARCSSTPRGLPSYWPVFAKLPYLPDIRRTTPGRNLNLKPHHRKGGRDVWTISGCRAAETG